MSNRAISKTMWVIILVIIIVVAAAIGSIAYMLTRPGSQISFNVTSFAAAQGTGITFTVTSFASGGNATIYFGDGQSATGLTASSPAVTHTYANPGSYLVYVQENASGNQISSSASSLETISITSNITATNPIAPYVSVPVIAMNSTLNTKEPIVSSGDTAYFLGGYLESPSDPSTTITSYTWDFANGAANQTVNADSSSLDPVVNPVNTTFSAAGLYPVSLTLTTTESSLNAENLTVTQTYNTTYEFTVAVSTSAQPYALYTYGNVPDPGVIRVAENVAGGPYSFDPQVDYETVGYEVILNTMATLLVQGIFDN